MVCVNAGRIEKLSSGPGVDVVVGIAGDPDLICTAFDFVRCDGRIFLLVTKS
jgi:threonine dehydrogenase-like Zn-dependent dehydrogenase